MTNVTVEVYELERPTTGTLEMQLPIMGNLLGLFSSCAPKASNLAWLAYTNPGIGMETRTLQVLQAGAVLPPGAKVLGILSAKEGGMDLLILLRPTLQGRQIASMVHDELREIPAEVLESLRHTQPSGEWLQEVREKYVGKGPTTPTPASDSLAPISKEAQNAPWPTRPAPPRPSPPSPPSPQPVSGIASGATFSAQERADIAAAVAPSSSTDATKGATEIPASPSVPADATLPAEDPSSRFYRGTCGSPVSAPPPTNCQPRSSAPVDLRVLPQTPGFPGLAVTNNELDRIDQMRDAINQGCGCHTCALRRDSFRNLAVDVYPLLVEELRYWRARNPTV